MSLSSLLHYYKSFFNIILKTNI